MTTLRVVGVPLAMICGAVALLFFDVTAGLIWLAIAVALLIAKLWAWTQYPRGRFRVWPRMRP